MYKYSFVLFIALFSALTLAMSAEDFIQKPDTTSAKINPSGANIAIVKYAKDYNLVALINPQNHVETVVLDTRNIAVKKSKLHQISWIDNRYLAAQFSEKKDGVHGFRDTQQITSTIIIDTKNSTADTPKVKKIRTKGWLADALPKQAGVFIYAKRLAYSKLYRIEVEKLADFAKKLSKFEKIDGGQFTKNNEIFAIEGYVTTWFLDENGQPKSALKYSAKDQLELVDVNKSPKEPTVLKKWSRKALNADGDENSSKILLPIAAANEASTFYCLGSVDVLPKAYILCKNDLF